jgi:hypothetical protein
MTIKAWIAVAGIALAIPLFAEDKPEGQLYGVTIDSISKLPQIVSSLKGLSRKPTTRIVFDELVAANDYREAATKIHEVSYVMGEILDSFYLKQFSVDSYGARVSEYLDTLSDTVDIWEIGNEINGEWAGKTPEVAAKMTRAYDLVKARGLTTELTLYYNAGCYEKQANEMFAWAESNIPPRMKVGLDYVLVSYYEDDCENLQPKWQAVFDRLGDMFPNSKIGMGEVGSLKAAKKEAYMRRYYSQRIDHPRYVGGYFWWYGKQDLVPSSKPLWSVFNGLIEQ